MNDGTPADNLAINFPAVTYTENQHDDAVIINIANEPIVAHPVSPEISQRRALHCFSDATRIVQLCYAFVEEFEDALGVLRVQFGQLAVSEGGNFNLPSHDAS